jgi:ribonuclease J
VVAISSRTGEILAGPDLISRGVVGIDGAANLARAKAEVRDRLRGLNGSLRHNDAQVRHEMTRALRRYFRDTTGRRPLIVPYVMEV